MSDPKLKTGTNFCRCSGCGEHFGGVTAFDRHRQGQYPDRVCLAPSEMADRKGRPLLSLNSRGYWVMQFK